MKQAETDSGTNSCKAPKVLLSKQGAKLHYRPAPVDVYGVGKLQGKPLLSVCNSVVALMGFGHASSLSLFCTLQEWWLTKCS